MALCPLPSTEDFQFTRPLTEDAATTTQDDISLQSLQKLGDEVQAGITLTHLGRTSLFQANIRMVERYRVGNVFLAVGVPEVGYGR